MSIIGATQGAVRAVGAALAVIAGIAVSARAGGDLVPKTNSVAVVPSAAGLPDFADFSRPVTSFAPPRESSEPAPINEREKFSSQVDFSYTLNPRVGTAGRWIPLSRRERNNPGLEAGDVVGRKYHDGKRILEEIGRKVRFDRSYFDEMELQDTSYGTRFKEDAHDPRTLLSLKRISIGVPLYESGLTRISIELNADKLYRAVKGDIPQLRGGLVVNF